MKSANASLLLLIPAPLLAQELRYIDAPRLAACFDPVRARIFAVSDTGYSYDWDGSMWRQRPDRGAAYGFPWFDTATGRVLVMASFAVWADAANSWTQLPAAGGPSPRTGTTLVHDSARNEVVAFGGFDDWLQVAFDETWVFNGAVWARRLPATVPPARWFASAAFDSARQRVVLFGGRDVALLGDTWEWDGSTWSPVHAATSPGARALAGMAFDPVHTRTMLVGGNDGSAMLGDHWQFDGQAWTQQPPPPPDAVAGRFVDLVADPGHGETLLLAGRHDYSMHGDIWAWNGTTWSRKPDFGRTPVARFGSGVAAAAGGQPILVFGGNDGGQLSDELWQWTGRWSLAASGGPPPRADGVMWTQSGSTWLFSGGGNASLVLADTWRWNGVGWSLVSDGWPPGRQLAAIALDSTANRAVLFGGENSSGVPLGDTWTFDGSSWQAMTTTTQPPNRIGHAMAYDPVRQRVVLFGGAGQNSSGWFLLRDTWEWDGVAWQRVTTQTLPSSRGSMVFDPISQRIVLATSGDLTQFYELWSYDGVDWTPLPALGTASAPQPLYGGDVSAVLGAGDRLLFVNLARVHELLATPASASTFGQACGTAPPALAAMSLPRPGIAGFGLELTGVPSNSVAAIVGADAPAAVPLLGCTLLVAPGQLLQLLATSASGYASLPLPLPAGPGLLGLPFYFQGAALSTGSPGGVAFSAGLRVSIGH